MPGRAFPAEFSARNGHSVRGWQCQDRVDSRAEAVLRPKHGRLDAGGVQLVMPHGLRRFYDENWPCGGGLGGFREGDRIRTHNTTSAALGGIIWRSGVLEGWPSRPGSRRSLPSAMGAGRAESISGLPGLLSPFTVAAVGGAGKACPMVNPSNAVPLVEISRQGRFHGPDTRRQIARGEYSEVMPFA